MIARLLRLFLCVASICSAADLVPSAKLPPARMRVVNGTYGLGVPGGIPTGIPEGYTVVDIVPDGSDIGTPLQAALGGVGENWGIVNKVFLIPAGNYTMGGVTLPGNHVGSHNYIIRGAGSGSTNIAITGAIAKSADYPRFGSGEPAMVTTDVVSGLTKDSTSIVVDSAAGLGVGYTAQIAFPNDYSDIIVLRPNATGQYIRGQFVVITAISGNTVSFTPPLPDDFTHLETLTGLPVQLVCDTERFRSFGVGIEGITLTRSGASTAPIITLAHFVDSWMKDVKFSGQLNWGMILDYAINFEINKCWIGRTGDTTFHSNMSGLLPSWTTNLLIVDSILEGNFPCLELWVSNTNVGFLYNFIPWAGNGIGFNCHNAHNSFLTIEGNVMPNIQVETYFGSNSNVIAHRNWIFGWDASAAGTPADYNLFSGGGWSSTMDIQRFVRQNAIVGNLLRSPHASPSDTGHFYGYPYQYWTEFGDATPSTNNWWYDWDTTNHVTKSWTMTMSSPTTSTMTVTAASTAEADDLEASLVLASSNGGSRERWFSPFSEPTNGFLGTRAGDSWPVTFNVVGTPPTAGAMIVYPGVWGFREHDHDVVATTIIRGNYNYYDTAIPAGEAIGADTLQDSVVYDSKPSWFGSLAWPPIDPTNAPATFNQATIENILPAAWRYYNGNEDYLGGVASPAPSPTPGTYSSTQSFTLTCATPDADIYYTLDGTTPTTSSTLYTGAISVSVTTTIKSFAVKDGLEDSSVTTSTYTITTGGGSPSYNVGRLRFLRR